MKWCSSMLQNLVEGSVPAGAADSRSRSALSCPRPSSLSRVPSLTQYPSRSRSILKRVGKIGGALDFLLEEVCQTCTCKK